MSSVSVFDPVETAIQTVAAGGLVIVTDDEGRENEGDQCSGVGTAGDIGLIPDDKAAVNAVFLIEYSDAFLDIADANGAMAMTCE